MALATITDRYSAEQIRAYHDAGYWRAQTMFDALEQQVAARPDKVFVTDSTTSYTYRARAAFPKMGVLSLYGRTENLVTTMCTLTDDPDRSVTTDGKALPGQEVQILDEVGDEVPWGAEGDIAYCGSSNCLEYIHQERVEAVTELPMTATGKIQKHVLRADIARKLSDG